MSLDVYLYAKKPYPVEVLTDPVRDFLAENGWQYGDIFKETPEDEVYSANITHNMGQMASAVDLYLCLWRPEEKGWSKARDIIRPLGDGIVRLESGGPGAFREYEPFNGWGSYAGLLDFARAYLGACTTYPEARIEVSR